MRTLLLLFGFFLLLSPAWVLALLLMVLLRRQQSTQNSRAALPWWSWILAVLAIILCWLGTPEVKYLLHKPFTEIEVGARGDVLIDVVGAPKTTLDNVTSLNEFMADRGLRCWLVLPELTHRYGMLRRVSGQEPRRMFRQLKGEVLIYSGFSFILVRMEDGRVAELLECAS